MALLALLAVLALLVLVLLILVLMLMLLVFPAYHAFGSLMCLSFGLYVIFAANLLDFTPFFCSAVGDCFLCTKVKIKVLVQERKSS